MRSVLVLEDGTYFPGEGFGQEGETVGEVVFNTCMTGYQGITTDPSYNGQIVTMTYPLIGNYGFNTVEDEPCKTYIKGFIVKELCENPSGQGNSIGTNEYFLKNNIIGLKGIDTRALTQHIRIHGSMHGIISTECGNIDILLEKLNAKKQEPHDPIAEVSVKEPVHITGSGKRVVLLDLGTKRAFIKYLQKHGCDIHILPASSTFDDVMTCKPDGIFVSGGPGDPKALVGVKRLLQSLIGKKPILGISLGHLLLGLALGGNTYKMKFGHHGANYPVKDFVTGRCYITSQSHNYALDNGIGNDVEIMQVNINDNTVEGFRHKTLPVAGVQYYPEAAEVSGDSDYIFEDFLKMI